MLRPLTDDERDETLEASPAAIAPPREPDYRFTLANERTFLSWVRTSLALIGGGVAIARFLTDSGPDGLAVVAGVALVVFGAVASILAYRRWQQTDTAIRADRPIPTSAMPMVLASALSLGALVAAVLLIAEAI